MSDDAVVILGIPIRDSGDVAVLVPNILWFRPHLGRIGVAAAKSRLPTIGS